MCTPHLEKANVLGDRGSEFPSKEYTWSANKLGLIKVFNLPYMSTGNSVIEWIHTFLKASLRKFIWNHHIDLDEIAHIECNVFPYLMFGCDAFMLTLFKSLLPKLRHMGAEKCGIHLDAMWEIYMMAVLILKLARDKWPPHVRDPLQDRFQNRRHGSDKEPYPKRCFWLEIPTQF